MGSAAGLGILLLLRASAPEGDARPEGRPTDTHAEARDGLKEVPFTPRALPAHARLVIAPDLRNPFRDGPPPRRRTNAPPPDFGHGDLKNPFSDTPVPPATESAPADLRDPFAPDRPAPEHCTPATTDGVKIQRPKQLRCPKSSTGPAGTRYAAR